MRICPKCSKKYSDSIVYCPHDGQGLVADAGQSDEQQQLNNRVLGQYRLEDVLAEGGMGIVFSATHVKLGRRVALKMLRPEFAGNKNSIGRFFREARAVNEIKHENIIEITDFIKDQEGDNYYIMELLDGKDLRHLLFEQGPLPTPRALSIAIQVANALAAVHRAGIVHRDLKTENIFLVKRGDNPDFVKLLDFGVAKLIRNLEEQEASQTVEGTILGTADYMSPEQASGRPVDFRTDIYSLGVVLYEMLTGRRPITGNSFSEVLYNQVNLTPTRPSRLSDIGISLPVHLEKLVMQCLEKNPEARPQSMEEVESRLRSVGRGGSVSTESVSMEMPPPPRKRRWRPAMVLGTLLVLAAGLGLGWFLLFARGWPGSEAGNETGASQTRPATDVPKSGATTAETVEIRFETTPPGAEVHHVGVEGSLGATPVTLSFPRDGSVHAFELRLKGYQPARRKVSLAGYGVLRVNLLRSGKSFQPKSTDRYIDNDGTLDPFQE